MGEWQMKATFVENGSWIEQGQKSWRTSSKNPHKSIVWVSTETWGSFEQIYENFRGAMFFREKLVQKI